MNQQLMFEYNMKMAHEPVDLNTAAVTGARISMATGSRLAIMCVMGDSTGATVQFTLRQHTLAAGGTSKNLSVANVYYKKAGAATVFTKVEPSVEAAVYDLSADFAAEPGIVVFEVLADQLDTNGGFDFVSVDIADSGAAKLASTVYVVQEAHFKSAHEVAV